MLVAKPVTRAAVRGLRVANTAELVSCNALLAVPMGRPEHLGRRST